MYIHVLVSRITPPMKTFYIITTVFDYIVIYNLQPSLRGASQKEL